MCLGMVFALGFLSVLFVLGRALVKDGKEMHPVERALTITGMLLLGALMIQSLFDPLAPYRNQRELNKLQKELNAAEKKWNLQNITNYSFEVEFSSYSIGHCGAIITVQQGNIVEIVETMRGGWEKLPEPRALPETKWDDSYCSYSHFTIPEDFVDIQNGINAGGTVDVSFDPTYGLVTECDIDSDIRTNALLHRYTFSNRVWYKISNFHRLEPSTP